ncbi:MAG: hypothetical protein SCALA702_09820 [Melioribacteraceae bacterium]|nr:MAG: hypothetical protein SCALA702_09820 [Melioribacteraceae bacterium]
MLKKSLTYLILLLAVISCQFDTPTESTSTDKDVPSNPNPSSGSIGTEIKVTLSWAAPDLERFDVFFGYNSPPDSAIARDTTVTSIAVDSLLLDTQYFWKVVGKYADGTLSEGPIWEFTTKTTPAPLDGYVMQKYSIETELPSYVNILFQVLDIQGGGIEFLTEDAFVVLENDQQISSLESALSIQKKEEIDYVFRTVLMLDNSASLTNDLDEIKTAAIAFVNEMTTKQEVALFKFSDQPEEILDFTSNKSALIAAINSIEVGFNTTNLYGAVIAGSEKWTNAFTLNGIVQGAIVLFTDGSDTQGSYSLDDALTALGSKRCYTLGLGDDIDPIVLEILGNSGFYSTDDVNRVAEQFLEIQAELDKFANSFYILRYLSPKRGNEKHLLRLYIKDNNYTGANSFITGEFNSNGFYSVSPGLYINTSPALPNGINEISLNQNETVTVQAKSYLVYNTPYYLWQSGNTSIAAVAPDPDDNSVGVITATGTSGQQTTIVVIDFNNDVSKLLTVKIK